MTHVLRERFGRRERPRFARLFAQPQRIAKPLSRGRPCLVALTSAQQTEKGVRTFSTWAPVTYEGLSQRVAALDSLAAYSSIGIWKTSSAFTRR